MSDNQEADMYSRGLEKAQKEIEELKKQNEIMKEALEFYAEKNNWGYVNQNCQISMKQDAEHNVNYTATFAGKRARQALEKIK